MKWPFGHIYQEAYYYNNVSACGRHYVSAFHEAFDLSRLEMNSALGQNYPAGSLSGDAKSSELTGLSDVSRAHQPSEERAYGQGLKASNQFARLLRGIEVRAEQLDFSCSGHFEARLTEKAEGLVVKLEAVLQGIVTRVDVDNLSMLKLCVNALIVEGADNRAFKYACIARDWCERADFTDSVATGTALTATAEMFCRLRRYEEAAKLFKASTAAFSTILNYEHPLTAYSRKRHRMTLSKLALSERNKYATAFGAGYLKVAESENLCPLVWEATAL